MNTVDYITNCISRILLAPCLPANEYRRAYDIARAISDGGYATNIHLGLVEVCRAAEDGYYNRPLPAAAATPERESITP